MTPFYSDGRVTLYQGHVLTILRALPEASVQTVVTSPPYWGLRNYNLAPVVWGGVDTCAHTWTHEVRGRRTTGGTEASTLGERKSAEGVQRTIKRQMVAEPPVSSYCACGAWRGHLGLEPVHDCLAWATGGELSADCYVCHLVAVFREVRRVLRADGTLWLNLGDTYIAAPKGPGGDDKSTLTPSGVKYQRRVTAGTKQAANAASEFVAPHRSFRRDRASFEVNAHKGAPRLKPKDLCGMPWRVALALQADGWWLRSDLIWHKANPMPSSVTDRPTTAHEYLFLLSKSRRYFYDQEAIQEPVSEYTHLRVRQDVAAQVGSLRANGGSRPDRPLKAVGRGYGVNPKAAEADAGVKQNPSWSEAVVLTPLTRNKRSVWTIPTQAFTEAHFATFPLELVQPCLLAGSSERGACRFCGAPWTRVVTKTGGCTGRSWNDHTDDAVRGQREDERAASEGWESGTYTVRTVGWTPTCRCPGQRGRAVPCVVLDPFAGAGTTLMVADQLGRHAVGIELNPDYAAMSVRRLTQAGMF